MRATRQHGLTVVAPLRAGAEREAPAAFAALQAACARVPGLHFARFVILPPDDHPFTGEMIPAKLAWECIHDGERAALLAALTREAGEPLAEVLGLCEGFDGLRRLAAFVDAHDVPCATFYLGHGGLSVEQILNDAAVRREAHAWVDRAREEARLNGRAGREHLDALRRHLRARGLSIARVDRGLPSKLGGTLRAYLIELPGPAARMLPIMLRARLEEQRDDDERRSAPPRFVLDTDARCQRVFQQESVHGHNALTHLVPLKPGPYRRRALERAFAVVRVFTKWTEVHGTLTGLNTIHFARWCLLPDGRLLFFSNYDGSWEAYLGDFIDKAATWLSLIWTNAKWFPATEWLGLREGARDEESFKRWARHFQCPYEVWYSAYPTLSVSNVLDNAALREALADPKARAADVFARV